MSRTPFDPIRENPFMRRQVRDLNRIVDGINEQRNFSGDGGVDASQLPGGVSFDTNSQQFRLSWFYGVVLSEGPFGEADFKDARYWVRSVGPMQAAGTTEINVCSVWIDDSDWNSNMWGVATHLAEALTETHILKTSDPSDASTGRALPVDATLVRVWIVESRKQTSNPTEQANVLWVFETLPDAQEFDVRITSAGGSFPVFDYTGERVTGYNPANTGYLVWTTDGKSKTLRNTFEFGPQSGYPYTHGTGVTVTASDGTVNSGSCKIKPIGVGTVVKCRRYMASPSSSPIYRFSAANSAQ